MGLKGDFLMRVAVQSYNTFVPGEPNGWRNRDEHHVLLLQNADGKTWGTSQSGKSAEEWKDETKVIVDPLWETLRAKLPTIDAVVMYVGSHGAEHVIQLAAENGLTPDRAVFVFCDCNMSAKTQAIRDGGFSASRVIPCECGGHATMHRIYQKALTEGTLPN